MYSSSRTTQRVFALHSGRLESIDLPHAEVRLGYGNLCWGDASEPLTPAYWAAQTWMWELDSPDHYRLGRTLGEEVLACLLGGYGIPAEVGLAAYERLRRHVANGGNLIDHAEVEALLSEALIVDGRRVRYRFARQKAAYVSAAWSELPSVDETLDDIPLRNRLMNFRGVGPKTASWVVRNLRGSDQVAILDVHILRAGRLLGIFDGDASVEKHYRQLEVAYLAFATAIGTRSSILDSVMWMTIRQLSLASNTRPISVSQQSRIASQPELAF